MNNERERMLTLLGVILGLLSFIALMTFAVLNAENMVEWYQSLKLAISDVQGTITTLSREYGADQAFMMMWMGFILVCCLGVIGIMLLSKTMFYSVKYIKYSFRTNKELINSGLNKLGYKESKNEFLQEVNLKEIKIEVNKDE